MKVIGINGSARMDGNTALIIREVFSELEKNGIEYDEIFFGKPNADITIDDRVVRFENWDVIDEEYLKQKSRSK